MAATQQKFNPQTKKLEDLTAACNRCGFCTSYCPTYLATGDEQHSPRGRNQLFRSFLEGRLPNPQDLAASVDGCLLCGECTSVCFSGVPTADLMVQARWMIAQKKGFPFISGWILHHILLFPQRLHWVLKLAFIVKNLRIPSLFKKIPWIRKHFPELVAADDLVTTLPMRFLKEYPMVKNRLGHRYQDARIQAIQAHLDLEKGKKAGQPLSVSNVSVAKEKVLNKTVAYFPVCGSQYLAPRVGLSTLKILDKLSCSFMIPDGICCGLPPASMGQLPLVRKMAEGNMMRLEGLGLEHIVVDDSSCLSHMKEYPKYFADDPVWLPRAQAFAMKVKEFSAFCLYLNIGTLLKNKSWKGGPLAYHDPCKSQYSQKNVVTPREILSLIPGLTLIPIHDADQCCGGGGTYSFTHPDISRSVLQAKVKNIMNTGAQTVISSSASCLTQLAYGLREQNSKIEVLHLSEFLARIISD